MPNTSIGVSPFVALAWSAAGLLAALLLPWYSLQEGLDSAGWLAGLWSSEDYASGVAQALVHGRWWLAPVLLALAVGVALSLPPMTRERRGTLLVLVAAIGLILFAAQAFGIGLRGWTAAWLNALFGEMETRQAGIGAGAAVVLVALLSLLAIGLALRGAFGGDAFVAGAMATVAASIQSGRTTRGGSSPAAPSPSSGPLSTGPARGSEEGGDGRLVGGRAVTRMKMDIEGGSSSVFSSAFWAAGTSASASSMMTTRRLPSNGRYAARSTASRTCSILIEPVSPGWRTRTSGWTPRAMRAHAVQAQSAVCSRQSRKGAGLGLLRP